MTAHSTVEDLVDGRVLDDALRRRPGSADREATAQELYYDGDVDLDAVIPWDDHHDHREAEL